MSRSVARSGADGGSLGLLNGAWRGRPRRPPPFQRRLPYPPRVVPLVSRTPCRRRSSRGRLSPCAFTGSKCGLVRDWLAAHPLQSAPLPAAPRSPPRAAGTMSGPESPRSHRPSDVSLIAPPSPSLSVISVASGRRRAASLDDSSNLARPAMDFAGDDSIGIGLMAKCVRPPRRPRARALPPPPTGPRCLLPRSIFLVGSDGRSWGLSARLSPIRRPPTPSSVRTDAQPRHLRLRRELGWSPAPHLLRRGT